MEVFTPNVGFTYNTSDLLEIVGTHPEKIVAQLFIMCGYGDEPDASEGIHDEWYDYSLRDTHTNIAEEILKHRDENGYIRLGVDLGYTVTLIAPEPDNRFNLVAIVRHSRMSKGESLDLLKFCAYHNIFTIPVNPCLFPSSFTRDVFDTDIEEMKVWRWTPQTWDAYIKYILARIWPINDRLFGTARVPTPDV